MLASLFGTLSTDSKMVLDAALPSFNMDQPEHLCTINYTDTFTSSTKNNAVHHYTGFSLASSHSTLCMLHHSRLYFVFVGLSVCCTVKIVEKTCAKKVLNLTKNLFFGVISSVLKIDTKSIFCSFVLSFRIFYSLIANCFI